MGDITKIHLDSLVKAKQKSLVYLSKFLNKYPFKSLIRNSIHILSICFLVFIL